MAKGCLVSIAGSFRHAFNRHALIPKQFKSLLHPAADAELKDCLTKNGLETSLQRRFVHSGSACDLTNRWSWRELSHEVISRRVQTT